MSKKKNNHAAPSAEVEQVTPEVEVETPDVDVVEHVEVPVEEPNPQFTIGKVIGCHRLNVREHPDTQANVMCTLPAATEVQVNISNDYADWYHVCAPGVDGFCMKKYISINH